MPRGEPSPRRTDRSDKIKTDKTRDPEVNRGSEKVRDKEPAKKIDEKSTKKTTTDGGANGKDEKSKQRTSNGADYEKKREYQVKITEQKISYKETVRGKQQPESRQAKISISSSSTPSRTPSPFLKPHERKDYVPVPKPQSDVQQKSGHKAVTKKVDLVSSDDDVKESKPKRRRSRSIHNSREIVKASTRVEVIKKDSRKSDSSVKKKVDDEGESRKRPAADAGSDVESIASEKSKKRKKKNRDGSVSGESEKKKKRSKLKKHKKSSKKSKKKDRSVSREKSSDSEEEPSVNEYLEKKLREKALVSLMRKNKKAM